MVGPDELHLRRLAEAVHEVPVQRHQVTEQVRRVDADRVHGAVDQRMVAGLALGVLDAAKTMDAVAVRASPTWSTVSTTTGQPACSASRSWSRVSGSTRGV